MSGRPQRIIKLTDKIKNPNNVAEREGTHRKQFAQASALHPADSEASISALSSNVSTAENTALSHTAPSQSQPPHPEPEESFEIAVAPPAVVSEENGDLESDSEPVHIPKAKRRLAIPTFSLRCDTSPSPSVDDSTILVESAESSTSDEEINDRNNTPISKSTSHLKQTTGKRKQKAKKDTPATKRARQSTFDEVDGDGFLKDVDVQEIPAPKAAKSVDLDLFFQPSETRQGANGTLKAHRRCTICLDKPYIVADVSTLRRHIEAKHAGVYRKWAADNNFESKLPGDVKKRKEANAKIKLQQQQLDAHLKEMPKKERVIAYSELAFKRAAIEWMIFTNQPIQALEHPTFASMIQIAARATDGVTIPSRKACRSEIMRLFHEEINGLIALLADTDKVKGLVSLTCDAWQAGNTDGYFAVTAHWIQELPNREWELRSALIGFTQLNNAHNGPRLGQALFKIVDRLGIADKIGHVTCDNAKNNGTMLKEFAFRLEQKTGKPFDYIWRRVNCLAHIINLAAQALITAYSKSPHYDPSNPDAHLPFSETGFRDEVGLIRAITVKERSSAKRKEIFRLVQLRGSVVRPLQLLLDMPVRWSSTYVMLDRAESKKEFVDIFVYEIGLQEKSVNKRAKIDNLRPTEAEWDRIKLFIDLLGHADHAQQAFSSDRVSTLHLAIPALEALFKAWDSRRSREKYASFAEALSIGTAKIAEYYDKTGDSDAYIVSMYLHPEKKGSHFKKHWAEPLQNDAKTHMENIFKAKYFAMNSSNSLAIPAPLKGTSIKITTLLRELSDDESDDDHPPSRTAELSDPNKPWKSEFDRYLETIEQVPEGMDIIKWWGFNAHRYPVWAQLARDYLAIMASSVSSERAFSQGGLTISPRRNRLKADIVEAIQFVKCSKQQDLIFREAAPSSALELKLESDLVDGEQLTDGTGVQGDPSIRMEPSWDCVLLDSDDEDLFE
ncbi:hypothetical protein PHLCEN_2v9174 [Hermanssonia centrifuga]|uniref:HAT C-terminal dimerisation domain-containing protein n=1 Tax=Hermanssonia centrifuga TaxID=98765 RepID=A0A2R6NRD8_9APHY|nr:hypothetical protein PHLCEN_2v9174 [Hermanssonia centrifuga]